jgi:hypothetical protein
MEGKNDEGEKMERDKLREKIEGKNEERGTNGGNISYFPG